MRDCSADAAGRTTIKAASASEPGLRVEGNLATVYVERLRIEGADQAQSSGNVAGSVFALIVRGSDRQPSLALDEVTVVSGRGADGPVPASSPPAGNVQCSGTSDCVDNGADGTSGSSGSTGGLGSFGPTGYVPGDGKSAAPGGAGGNGTPGGDGTSCTNCFGACTGASPICLKTTAPALFGGEGLCGCGGLGGPAGGPGRGGGASVGILVAGEASVIATSTVVRSGRGGDASAGADGTEGGKGTDGSPGADQTCGTTAGTTCDLFGSGLQCTQGTTTAWCTATGGGAGGSGHPGGKGGRGGHGFGGPSFAVVTVENGGFTAGPGTSLLSGSSGQNGDQTVPAGNSGPILAQ